MDLVETYARRLKRTANIELDDARQEVRIMLWHLEKKYQPALGERDHFFSRYLKRRVDRLSRMTWTRKRREQDVLSIYYTPPILLEDQIVNKLFIEELYRALSAQAQDVLVCMTEGLSQRVIGNRLSLSQGRVSQITQEIRSSARALYAVQ